jgi:hypothetical protein
MSFIPDIHKNLPIPLKLVLFIGLFTGCAFPQGKSNNEQQYSLPVKAEELLQNAQIQGAQ